MTIIRFRSGGTYDLMQVQTCFIALRDLSLTEYRTACDLVQFIEKPDCDLTTQAKTILCEAGLMERGQPLRPIVGDTVRAAVVGSGTDIGFLWPERFPPLKVERRIPPARP